MVEQAAQVVVLTVLNMQVAVEAVSFQVLEVLFFQEDQTQSMVQGVLAVM